LATVRLSEFFIRRRTSTLLLALGVVFIGLNAYFALPVAPLPQVDFPTISVSAHLPGASAETMATSVATPLERSLANVSGVTEMTSSSSLGSARVVLVLTLYATPVIYLWFDRLALALGRFRKRRRWPAQDSLLAPPS
jgi:multidrug efflux pump subunit AcrB